MEEKDNKPNKISKASVSRVQGSRQGSGSASGTGQRSGGSQAGRSQGTRPRSATAVDKKRTSTGRPLEKSASPTVRTAGGNKTVSAGRHPVQKRKKKRYIESRSMIIASVVTGLVLAFIITLIMRASMLRVKQTETDYNIGDVFNINSFFEPSSKDSCIEFDNESFTPDKLGKCKVKFTVRRGKLKTTKKRTINVVDVVKPYIDGPDDIEVSMGEEIKWSEYYTVTDEDPDIQGKLQSSEEIDTGKEDIYTTTLTVKDWAGNESSKEVRVFVISK